MDYNTAMPSGYDYEFVLEPPDDYNCSICHLVMRKPVQTKCGHQFCKECLEEANKRNPQCPEDREPLTAQDVFEDKAMGRKTMSLVIKCQEQACIWQGELRDIENHENKCDYKIVDCDNESCSVRKPRCEMVGHVQDDCLYRIVSCTHCKNAYTFCLLEQHTSECPQCPVSCPNNCGKTITREQVTSHTSTECPLTIVPCSYQNIGCNFTVQRQLLNDHIENHVKQHLTIAVEKIVSIQNQTTSVQNQVDEMKKKMPPTNAIESIQSHTNDIECIQKQLDENPSTMTKDDEKRYSFIWKIKDFSQQLETAKQSTRDIRRLYSEPFYTNKYGYKLKLVLKPNGFLRYKGTHVSVFLIVMRAKQSGRDIKLSSEPFYTHKYGYKLKLRIDPNGYGNGKGTHLSVFLVVMRGEYDALLTWPFDWEVKFILMNQKPNPLQQENIEMSSITDKSLNSFKRPTKDENIPYEFFRFVSHETLATENYVENGTLFLKLEIEKTEQLDKVLQLMTN